MDHDDYDEADAISSTELHEEAQAAQAQLDANDDARHALLAAREAQALTEEPGNSYGHFEEGR